MGVVMECKVGVEKMVIVGVVMEIKAGVEIRG